MLADVMASSGWRRSRRTPGRRAADRVLPRNPLARDGGLAVAVDLLVLLVLELIVKGRLRLTPGESIPQCLVRDVLHQGDAHALGDKLRLCIAHLRLDLAALCSGAARALLGDQRLYASSPRRSIEELCVGRARSVAESRATSRRKLRTARWKALCIGFPRYGAVHPPAGSQHK